MSKIPTSIKPYDGSNYESWSKDVKRHLNVHKDDLWDFVDGTRKKPTMTSDAAAAASPEDLAEHRKAVKLWEKGNDAAFEIIKLTMREDKQSSIQNLEYAADAWQRIREEATTESMTSAVHQIKALFQTRMTDSTDMATYLADINNKAARIKDNGFPVPDIYLIYVMIDGLPEKHADSSYSHSFIQLYHCLLLLY